MHAPPPRLSRTTRCLYLCICLCRAVHLAAAALSNAQPAQNELEGETALQAARDDLNAKLAAAEEERQHVIAQQQAAMKSVEEAISLQAPASHTSLRLHSLSLAVISVMSALETRCTPTLFGQAIISHHPRVR